MRIVGVNGIASNGEHNIDLLLAELASRGREVIDVTLPVRHWFSARWGGCADGQVVAEHSQDGDIIVCHSFGGIRAWHAHKFRNFAHVVCIAPAMSDAAQWRYPDRVHCFWSRRDLAVRIGARLLFHPFGAAGSKGFTQEGVRNIEKSAGHSEYFAGDLLREVADYVESLSD